MSIKLALIVIIGILATLNYGQAQKLSTDENRIIKEYKWVQYEQLNTTYDWMRAIAKKYPKQVSLFNLGKTYEGREILGARISFESSTKKASGRRSVFIDAGLHAREWISPATATFILNLLLTSTDARVRKIAESHVWYVVPNANPDGYVYTQTEDRMWRKNRKPYGNCVGTDLNRNWDFHWMEVGASADPCEITYAGPEPFSESETRGIADYMNKIKDELVLYLSLHSYAETIIFPYGHTSELPANYGNLKRVADVGVDAFFKRYGSEYLTGTVNNLTYPDSGTSTDWAYGKINIPYVYCFELRPLPEDYSGVEFLLPADQIIPTGEETVDALVAMLGEIDVFENKSNKSWIKKIFSGR